AGMLAAAMGGSSLGSSGGGGSAQVSGEKRYATGELKELFYNGRGGVSVKNGGEVPHGFVSGHTDHVHVAAGPQRIQQLAKLAQQLGLHVGELAPFEKVGPVGVQGVESSPLTTLLPVHVQGSYPYRNRAADISGDPSKMAAYSKLIAQMF